QLTGVQTGPLPIASHLRVATDQLVEAFRARAGYGRIRRRVRWPRPDAWRRLRASRESTQRRRAPPSAPRERSGRRRPPARGSSGTARTSRRSNGRSRLERYGRAALEGNRRPWQNPPMTSSGRLATLSVVVAIGAVPALDDLIELVAASLRQVELQQGAGVAIEGAGEARSVGGLLLAKPRRNAPPRGDPRGPRRLSWRVEG